MAPKREKLKSGKDYKTRTIRIPAPDSPRLEWDLHTLEQRFRALSEKAAGDSRQFSKQLKEQELNLTDQFNKEKERLEDKIEELEWQQIPEKGELAHLKDEYARDNALWAEMATIIKDWAPFPERKELNKMKELQAKDQEDWETLNLLFECLTLDNQRKQELREIEAGKHRALVVDISASNKGLAQSLMTACSEKAHLRALNTQLGELNGYLREINSQLDSKVKKKEAVIAVLHQESEAKGELIQSQEQDAESKGGLIKNLQEQLEAQRQRNDFYERERSASSFAMKEMAKDIRRLTAITGEPSKWSEIFYEEDPTRDTVTVSSE